MMNQTETQEKEYVPNAKDNREDLEILTYQTHGALESILEVLKHFKEDHYESKGDVIDELLDEIADSVNEISEII